MMHTSQALYDELRSSLVEIERQMEAVKRYAMMHTPVHVEPEPDFIYRMQDTSGKFLLSDLIAAKAQVLSAMAALKAASGGPKKPGGTW